MNTAGGGPPSVLNAGARPAWDTTCALTILSVLMTLCCGPVREGEEIRQNTRAAGPTYSTIDMDGSAVDLRVPTRRFVLGEEGGPGLLHKPSSVAIADNDEVYVLDAGNYRVAVFSTAGDFVREFGGPGHGPGEFTGNEKGLALSRDMVFVLDGPSVTISRISTQGTYIDEFRLANGVADLTVMGQELVATHTPRAADESVVRVIGTEGTVAREFGQLLAFPQRNPNAVRVLNRASAAGNFAELAIAYRHWPVVRFYERWGELSAEYWYRLEWGDTVEHEERTWRNPDWVDDEGLDMGYENIRVVVFWDIEYAARADQWFLLSGFHVVQAIERDGSPAVAYDLREVDEQASRRMFTDLAVSSTARVFCAVDSLEEEVVCFDFADASSAERE